MMDDTDDRGAGLVAGALAGELTTDEQDELDRLLASDPALRDEYEAMASLLPSLRATGARSSGPERATTGMWRDDEPGPGLRDAVLRIPEPRSDADRTGRVTTRSWPQMAVGAAACLVLGVALTLGAQSVLDAPPQGPPGTFGAVETVALRDAPEGVEIDGSLVAHTWGTETILEVDGLGPGTSFAVTLVGSDGERFESGTFFGSDVTIDCRMNAAVMRDDVERLEITMDDGQLIASADLPPAIDPEE